MENGKKRIASGGTPYANSTELAKLSRIGRWDEQFQDEKTKGGNNGKTLEKLGVKEAGSWRTWRETIYTRCSGVRPLGAFAETVETAGCG
ncbi:hypothetical protein KM043_013669 [Ampulex compressa]|nr:hypothetical protein KM043_013669 [Ampulex compressa]